MQRNWQHRVHKTQDEDKQNKTNNTTLKIKKDDEQYGSLEKPGVNSAARER